MAEHISELCTLLVDDLYGELSSRVFSILAKLGRLTIRGLVKYSDLSARDLKHGLAVLIQQGLVLHYTTEDEIYYEPHWDHAYSLVRAGKIVKMVEDRFGESAGGLVSNLLLLGHAKVSDLADAYGVSSKTGAVDAASLHVNGNGIANGEETNSGAEKNQNHVKTLDDLHRILRQLLDAGFVIPVRRRHFYPTSDLRNEAERIIKHTLFGGQVKGKQISEMEVEVNKLLKRWRDEEDDQEEQSNGVSAGMKRGREDNNPQARKRIKVNARLPNGSNAVAAGEIIPLDDELVVAVSQDKCTVALRTEQLVDYANRYLGETTAKVYHALLRQMEKKVDRCNDPFDQAPNEDDEADALPSVTAREVLELVDPSVDLAAAFGAPESQTNGVDHESDDEDEGTTANGTSQNNGVSAAAPGGRLHWVKQHLSLLFEDPRRFVRWVGSRGGGEYKVDFRPLSYSLIQHELEATVLARWGPLAARIIRILSAKGKLDEKQVSTTGLMRTKEIRAALTAMQEAGFVDTQEVPKDNTRAPSRTMYFWFFDQDRTRQLVLTDTYKAMARILQRIKVERAKVQSVIDKAERSDVIGNEDRFLTETEKRALRMWRETEEKLLVQLGRQDDLVAVLRDFRMPPIPKAAWNEN
ncbi:RNA polymerase III subunit RPC82-domain-containing protein [Macrophomina phaseolina]|uniref:DNA-directed RNA polymerase III subunit RPC3 n=1 Tax=Macrophomina phaseolina TaxID=35725 RepID=A0ABQ8GKL4_9PEZI|nr:RNA polymerase III subunit RPC82-domain-containing protein [Macrophomina phaseolina]